MIPRLYINRARVTYTPVKPRGKRRRVTGSQAPLARHTIIRMGSRYRKVVPPPSTTLRIAIHKDGCAVCGRRFCAHLGNDVTTRHRFSTAEIRDAPWSSSPYRTPNMPFLDWTWQPHPASLRPADRIADYLAKHHVTPADINKGEIIALSNRNDDTWAEAEARLKALHPLYMFHCVPSQGDSRTPFTIDQSHHQPRPMSSIPESTKYYLACDGWFVGRIAQILAGEEPSLVTFPEPKKECTIDSYDDAMRVYEWFLNCGVPSTAHVQILAVTTKQLPPRPPCHQTAPPVESGFDVDWSETAAEEQRMMTPSGPLKELAFHDPSATPLYRAYMEGPEGKLKWNTTAQAWEPETPKPKCPDQPRFPGDTIGCGSTNPVELSRRLSPRMRPDPEEDASVVTTEQVTSTPPYPTCHHCKGEMRHTLLESWCTACGFVSNMQGSGWPHEGNEDDLRDTPPPNPAPKETVDPAPLLKETNPLAYALATIRKLRPMEGSLPPSGTRALSEARAVVDKAAKAPPCPLTAYESGQLSGVLAELRIATLPQGELEAMAAKGVTVETREEPIGTGLAVTVLATQLDEAMRQDPPQRSGRFGPAVAKWLRGLAGRLMAAEQEASGKQRSEESLGSVQDLAPVAAARSLGRASASVVNAETGRGGPNRTWSSGKRQVTLVGNFPGVAAIPSAKQFAGGAGRPIAVAPASTSCPDGPRFLHTPAGQRVWTPVRRDTLVPGITYRYEGGDDRPHLVTLTRDALHPRYRFNATIAGMELSHFRLFPEVIRGAKMIVFEEGDIKKWFKHPILCGDGPYVQVPDAAPVDDKWAEKPIVDDFSGDDVMLKDSIQALIRMHDSGSLVPHGIGGHARALLAACYHRLQTEDRP